MLKVTNVVGPSAPQMEVLMRGIRNPMNSWSKSDSIVSDACCKSIMEEWDPAEDKNPCICEVVDCECNARCHEGEGGLAYIPESAHCPDAFFYIGRNDQDLAVRLEKAGPEHRKHLRMMFIWCDIEAPLFWWKQFETYRVGLAGVNSCSTMHKIHTKMFDISDFDTDGMSEVGVTDLKHHVIPTLNNLRDLYLVDKDKTFWQDMVNLLPESYIQKRTVCFSYETLGNMIRQRKNHKLGCWHEFIDKMTRYTPYFNWALTPIVDI